MTLLRARRALTLLLVLSLAAACSGTSDDLAALLDTHEYLDRLHRLGFAGVVVIARDGKPIYQEGFGLADRERGVPWSPGTVSTVGSITKQFTGAAILLLEEDGRLSVDDTIAEYLDGVPDDKRAITIHQLLTHSSGIVDLPGVDDWDPIGREEFVLRAMEEPLALEPGNGYDYSNAGYSLLGAIVENVTGDSYERFLRDRLLLPHDLRETGYLLADWDPGRISIGYVGDERWGTVLGRPMAEDGPYWNLRANGGIHSTSGDMLRWAEALMNGKVLSPESMAKYWAPHVEERGGESHYGYGWVVAATPDGRRLVTHNGGNGILFADIAIVPDDGLVMFVQTNTASGLPVVQSLLERIRLRLLDGEPYPAVPKRTRVPTGAIDAVAGEYRLDGDGGVLHVVADDRELAVGPEGEVAFGLLHSTRDFDAARAERLTTRIDDIVGAYVAGDFSPLHDAYEGRATVDHLRRSWDDSRAALEDEHGPLLGHRVLGTAMRDGRDVTVVRLLFERGHADLAYVWDPDADERLLGRSVRGLDPVLRFMPTGVSEFGSWDGGVSASRALRFEPGEDGRVRLRLDGGGGQVEAMR